MNSKLSLHIVSFATTGRSKSHRDYTKRTLEFTENASQLGLTSKVYSKEDILKIVPTTQAKLFKLRKGAGYWFWKPYVIRDAAINSNATYILYLDIDFNLVMNPIEIVENVLKLQSLAAFRQDLFLKNFAKKNVLDHFQLQETSAIMWTASAIACKVRDESALRDLQTWIETQENHRLLLDNALHVNNNHRHDQTILSCLIANKEISITDFGNGFWSSGKESRILDFKKAWLLNGNPIAKENDINSVLARLKKIRSLTFHRYQLILYTWQNYFNCINRSRKTRGR